MAKLYETFGSYQHANYYDALDVVEGGFGSSWGQGHAGVHSIRLFGNSNIGNVLLTNMQIAGGLPSDRSFVVQRWYARSNLPDRQPYRDAIKAWASAVSVVFVVGSRPVWRQSLYELLERRPRTEHDDVVARVASDPFPTFIPVRQSFSMSVDMFGQNELEQMRGVLAEAESVVPHRFWLHLEGLEIPDQRPGSPADRLQQYLIAANEKRMDEAELVARWLSGMIEHADPEARAQLHAVRDGVLEGRHRS